MSFHVEWLEAKSTQVEIRPPGDLIDGQIIKKGKATLVLSGDDFVAIEGSVKELDVLVARIVLALGEFKKEFPDV